MDAIEIVELALGTITGDSQYANGARYVLTDVLTQLKSAQQTRAADGFTAEQIATIRRIARDVVAGGEV